MTSDLATARRFVAEARFEEAEQLLRILLEAGGEADSDYDQALVLLADVLQPQGTAGQQEAYDRLRAAVAAHPQLYAARIRLGWLLCSAGEYGAVVEELAPGLDDDTAPPELYECLARALWELGRVDDSITSMGVAAGKRGQLNRWTSGFDTSGEPAPFPPFDPPRRPMRIGLVLRSGEISFSEDMLDTRPLGGTETAILRMGRALREVGHEVYFEQFPERLQQLQGVDALIIKRHPIILDPPLAKRVFFWAPDDVDQPFWDRLRDADYRARFVAGTTRLFALSQYQARGMIGLGIPEEKIFITKNGIDLRLFEGLPAVEDDLRSPRCVYTSDPSRGLRILLDVWPEIKRRVPRAELQVFSSMRLYLRGVKEKTEHKALYDRARNLPGVQYMSSVPQPQLAAALKQARLLTYPNIFPETSCIAALEAQAAGCAVVTSNLGALPETAWGNPLVFAPPDSPEYRAAFVAHTVEMLTNDLLWQHVSRQNRHRMQSYSWNAVAREWLALMAADME